jgi:hypothetical protein
MNSEVIDKVFLSQPGGTYTLILWYAVTVTGLIGAFGLLLGLRYVWSGHALRSRALGMTLIAIFFVVAPVLGLAHLMYLARRDTPTAPLAAS